MSETPEQIIPQEEKEELFKSMSEYHVIGATESIYTVLPKVFIDGYSLTKISLTDQFVNCSKYSLRSGLTFEVCVSYNRHNANNEVRDVRGIYYITGAPIYYFYTGRKLSRNESEMKQIILNHINSMSRYIKLNNKLLISYNNYGMTVYDRFVKGKIIKFPLTLEQGHLFVSWVPKVPTGLPYEKVSNISIYNHEIQFKTEITKFNISVSGGQAVLVYNHHSVHVIGNIKSPDHGEKEIELMHGSLYLFTHPIPVERRGTD